MLLFILGTAQDLFYFILFGLFDLWDFFMHNPLVVPPARHIYMLSLILGMAQDLFYFVLFSLLFRWRHWSGVCSLRDHHGFPTSRCIGKSALCHLRLLLFGLIRFPWRQGIHLSRVSARNTCT